MLTVATCPDRLVLERLLLGQVALPEAELLEAHVVSCPQCAATIRGLNADDPLVDAMRQARHPTANAPSEAAEALIPWLKRMQRKDATEGLTPQPSPLDTATIDVSPTATGTPPMATVLPTYDFLAAPQQADELGRLEQYRVLQAIGVGGMGMVFLAEDTRLQRQVALKVIKPELLERRDLHERFLTEARAIAAVEHDNIVVIFEAGDTDGVPYLVMPLLRGESLEDRLKREGRPLPIDEILRLGREIAAGLEAAHQRGLVHRDIKPSNLWLESRSQESGGRSQESGFRSQKSSSPALPLTPDSCLLTPDSCLLTPGRIKILDFGLARTLDATDADGERHAILGTPAYMSPEQGRGLPADARSDLFSLGCVMYRMATGRMPFQGKDVITTLLSVATETPVSPKVLNPKLPADLVALIEKLLAKKPDERFASAQEVVDAIRTIERKRQPKRIGRWLAALAACVVLAIAGSFAVSSYLHRPPPPVEVAFDYDEPDSKLVIQREDEAEEEIDVKQTPKLLLSPGTYAIRTKAAHETRSLWPASFVVSDGEPKAVPLRLVGLIRSYGGHSQTILALAVSPRKDVFLALTASNDYDLRLWNLQTEAPGIRIEGHESPVCAVVFSPDGKQALTGSGKALGRRPDTYVRIWDLDTRACLAERVGHGSSVTAVTWDPQGKVLISGDLDGVMIFWDAHTYKKLDVVDAHERSAIYGLAFLPDGKRAISCGSDTKLFLWDVEKRTIVKRLVGHTGTITAVAVGLDGKHVATSSKDGTIRIWDLEKGESLVLKGHDKDVDCVAYSPDGKRLLSGGRDAIIRLWNAETGELIHEFLGHKGEVHGVAFSADGRRAVSAGADRLVCLWELPK